MYFLKYYFLPWFYRNIILKDLELVVAELPNGVDNWMLNDWQCHVINDGALFLITLESNSKKYHSLEFYPVDDEILREMKLDFVLLDSGKLMMFNYG